MLIAKRADAASNMKHVPKIADFKSFGPGRGKDSFAKRDCRHTSPEAYAGRYSEKNDVYSFGHVMFRTFSAGSPCLRLWIERKPRWRVALPRSGHKLTAG
eukprot:584208-Amphidinium_carterae.1